MDNSTKRLERIELKLDDMSDHLSAINATLSAQHISLKEHIRRTEALEKQVEPLQNRMYMALGALSLLTVLSTIASLVMVFK